MLRNNFFVGNTSVVWSNW